MSNARTIKQLAEKTDDLQAAYLIKNGWTMTPPDGGPLPLFTKTVDGVDFTVGRGTATLIQGWLDNLV